MSLESRFRSNADAAVLCRLEGGDIADKINMISDMISIS